LLTIRADQILLLSIVLGSHEQYQCDARQVWKIGMFM
jgi:hypothetical protein